MSTVIKLNYLLFEKKYSFLFLQKLRDGKRLRRKAGGKLATMSMTRKAAKPKGLNQT